MVECTKRYLGSVSSVSTCWPMGNALLPALLRCHALPSKLIVGSFIILNHHEPKIVYIPLWKLIVTPSVKEQEDTRINQRWLKLTPRLMRQFNDERWLSHMFFEILWKLLLTLLQQPCQFPIPLHFPTLLWIEWFGCFGFSSFDSHSAAMINDHHSHWHFYLGMGGLTDWQKPLNSPLLTRRGKYL